MKIRIRTSLILISLITLIGVNANNGFAQIRRTGEAPMPKGLKNKLIKMRIEADKKEFTKLIERSEEVAKLSDEIHKSFKVNKSLTANDSQKLVRLEKLLKKIRRELNAKRVKAKFEEKKPKSLLHALSKLRKSTSSLFKELKKNTRHSISVAAIQSSNAVWSLVKFIRLRR